MRLDVATTGNILRYIYVNIYILDPSRYYIVPQENISTLPSDCMTTMGCVQYY